MPYSLIDFSKDKWVELHRLVTLADIAWHGLSSRDLEWRIKYYTNLCSGGFFPAHLFRMITYTDERSSQLIDPEPIGFVTIFPMKSDIVELHEAGTVSQYSFKPSHFKISRSPASKSFHYIQSLYMDLEHRKGILAGKMMRKGILDLLKKQYCGYKHRPYRIYCEAALPDGKTLAWEEGFFDAKARSHEGHPFYVFDSEAHPLVHISNKHNDDARKLAATIRALWH